MTRLVVESKSDWTKKKIEDAIHTETDLLRKAVRRIQSKLQDFENKYGKFDRDSLYGKVDDMELIEWEGELETLKRLQANLKSLEEITFEYK
jgi:predicted  nucleic acid-binding Zn-ribbon protein